MWILDGNPQLDSRSGAGRGPQPGLAAVRGRDRLDDGQAEAASRGFRTVVPEPVPAGDAVAAAAAVEAVEGPRRVLLGHAGTVVADLEHRAVAIRVEADGGGGARRGVRADVAEQVREDLADPRLVGGDHQARRDPRPPPPPRVS